MLFLRAPLGGSCPPAPAPRRHPGPQAGARTGSGKQKRCGALCPAGGGGVSRVPAPRLPAAPLATNPGRGSGATSPHRRESREGGRRGNQKINGILPLSVCVPGPQTHPQSIPPFFPNFFQHPPGKPRQGALVANSRKKRIEQIVSLSAPSRGPGKARERLRNIYSPRARRAAAGCEPSAPGTGLGRPTARPPSGLAAAAPLPGPSTQNTVETKAEHSPCCNSRGPGREKVPDRERRAQRRAGLEVDKILRPFHFHIKQLLFFAFFKKVSSKTSLDGTERGVWTQE